MGKSLYIAEKPSVAQEFAKALHVSAKRKDGYLESEDAIVTWCVGHLITMSYPEEYNPALKKWSLETLPFIPEEFKYEVIPSVAKQFKIVAGLLNRADVDTIYVCTDSGREGEYIYRLVEQEAHVKGKNRRRVWIDSQTEEEILRGIREAKDLSAYDNLSDSAYLRAKEDYLMGINFSRLLTLKYGNSIANFLGTKYAVVSVGRVMTCVLGMVVRREREIRDFVETPFYRVISTLGEGNQTFEGEWKAVKGSRYFESFDLYKENGFKERKKAEELIQYLVSEDGENVSATANLNRDGNFVSPQSGALLAQITSIEKKKEKKNPPMLFNLAELQNECSKRFKISPDETLRVVQELYEKKLVTYPRTDARVLSTAVAKEISKNLNGLMKYEPAVPYLQEIVGFGSHKNIAKTRYVDDKQITDHYAIIPTGQGMGALNGLNPLSRNIYDAIVRRFLAIFYPPAIYQKIAIVTKIKEESFFSNFKVLAEEGYLKVLGIPGKKAGTKGSESEEIDSSDNRKNANGNGGAEEVSTDLAFFQKLQGLKKGMYLNVQGLNIKEGKTSPPKRYNSGSLILAMENAGQLIEDEELRAQIKGSGIGTSATRGEILKKLFNNKYLDLNKKTQIVTPTLMGEMIYDVVDHSIRQLLNAELTASWEKGLNYVAEGTITSDEYMQKLSGFVVRRTDYVKQLANQNQLQSCYNNAARFYKNKGSYGTTAGSGSSSGKSSGRSSSKGSSAKKTSRKKSEN
ncbi:MAG: DNA topoisomerase [Dorea sp.]|nr:DNA topoisomerase [Dorea sp.]